MNKAKRNKNRIGIGKPSLLVITIGTIMSLAALMLFLVGANEKCGSSCGAVSVGAVCIIVSTPIIAYGLSLIFTSLLFWLLRQLATVQIRFKNHPYLWLIPGSIVLFFPICFVVVQIVRAILSI